MHVLTVRGATVRRSGTTILDSVSWTVNEGERWVILGPNGAGKSTLVQLIAGRVFPTSGQAEVVGEKLGGTDLSELRSFIGMTSAAVDAMVPDDETVFESVRTAAYGHLAAWREEFDESDDARAGRLLAALGLEGIAQRRVGVLSSGERKRLGIARALMPNPELLVLDEPTEGLDLGGRERVLASLSALASQPSTPVFIMVTHHVEEIPEGFTHALLMDSGRIVAQGPIGEVITAEHLSTLFKLPLSVSYESGRYSARLVREDA
ncbi:ABC transporter ATP-binding protein [Neoactinobaculum massilliense]|uniref:ABC transporter ATP-binding protein n=1 Tax=Neoactinobaculum massilliense TaxID=2364794 RepID=UPI000F52C035|nr:ATP-binding cassette domain-containing protein [Neoactinobaculum massilliense]